MPFIGASAGPASNKLVRAGRYWGSGVSYGAPAMDIRGALTSATGSTGMTVNKPAGVVSGDVIVIYAVNANTAMASTGFTEIHSALNSFEHLLWRTADGSEGTSFTLTWVGGSVAAVTCGAWQNGAGGTHFWDPSTPAAAAIASASSTTPTIPGLENSAGEATTKNGDIILWLCDVGQASGLPGITFPSGFAGITSSYDATHTCGMGWKKQATAGTVGTQAGSITNASSPGWGLQMVALQHNG